VHDFNFKIKLVFDADLYVARINTTYLRKYADLELVVAEETRAMVEGDERTRMLSRELALAQDSSLRVSSYPPKSL